MRMYGDLRPFCLIERQGLVDSVRKEFLEGIELAVKLRVDVFTHSGEL